MRASGTPHEATGLSASGVKRSSPGAMSKPIREIKATFAASRSCSSARSAACARALSLRAALASSSLMSPARSRASVISAMRFRSSALREARAARSSVATASTYACRTSATKKSPCETSRSETAWAFRVNAATRRGRCQRASTANWSVHSSCFGPRGNKSERTGFFRSPASTRSARASRRSARLASNAGLFQRAMATASSGASPSASDTSGGSEALGFLRPEPETRSAAYAFIHLIAARCLARGRAAGEHREGKGSESMPSVHRPACYHRALGTPRSEMMFAR